MAYTEQHKWINVQQKTFTKWFVNTTPGWRLCAVSVFWYVWLANRYLIQAERQDIS